MFEIGEARGTEGEARGVKDRGDHETRPFTMEPLP